MTYLGFGHRFGGQNNSDPLYDYAEDLGADPPTFSFKSTLPGMGTWRFRASSARPPFVGPDIASGSFSIIAGFNPLEIDSTSFPSQTGYLFFSGTGLTGRKFNTLRSSQFTTAANPVTNPVDETATTGATFSNITDPGNSNSYRLVKWETPGVYLLRVLTSVDIEYEVLPAGGSGGMGRGGGGGAGKRKPGTLTLAPGDYTITVGDGGAARITLGVGTAGGDSSIDILVIGKGGGRGAGSASSAKVSGGTGGHGGGPCGGDSGTGSAGTSNDGGNNSGTPGTSATAALRSGAAGGGEMGVGGNGLITGGGIGGQALDGFLTTFCGVAEYVCAGGNGWGTNPATTPLGANNFGSGSDGTHSGPSAKAMGGRVAIRWAA